MFGVALAAAMLGVATESAIGRPSTPGEGGSVIANAEAAVPDPVVLAYYYIWYEPRSWDRAKTDLPQLGPYDSSDPSVIAQHVAWARAAGIDALIVSWKHEDRLDGPLASLVSAARTANLKLVLLYQGLDYFRRPLEATRIGDDLVWFMNQYGDDPVFDIFGGPTIIFSGTPSFSDADIEAVRAAVLGAGDARLLGSERSAETYAAKRTVLDGDAYYWSSVDPVRDRFYANRLRTLAASVREDRGLWIAPVAPGFDAREVGGTRVVERADGATYRTQWETALATHPDGLGIISWNEFSENSQIEPSREFGTTYLSVTASLVRETLGRSTPIDPAQATAGPLPALTPRPTAAPAITKPASPGAIEEAVPVLVGLLLLLSLGFVARRRPTRAPTAGEPIDQPSP